MRQAREDLRSTLPLIASLTVISRGNYRHLAELYEAFRDRVDLFVFYLSWWIDEAGAQAHEEDFARRFGFPPRLHRGWVGGWRPDDYGELSRQLTIVKERSRAWSAPPVVVIPDLDGPEALQTYYTEHRARFGFERCVSIYQAAEVDSNGDVSPCRDYHDYVVGSQTTLKFPILYNGHTPLKLVSNYINDPPEPEDDSYEVVYYNRIYSSYHMLDENLAALERIMDYKNAGIEVIVVENAGL